MATAWQGIESAVGRLLGRVGLVPHSRPPFVTIDPRAFRYRQDPRLAEALGAELMGPTVWEPAGAPVIPTGELAEIFVSTPGFHKWPHYLPVYERTLAALRHRPVRLLEIGVFEGGSLAAWRRYLGPEATLVGIDIDPACAAHGDPAHGTYVRIGAQQDADFLQAVVDEFGPFDAVIDDGSHMASHLIASFRFLFLHGLAPGGVYLAEDLQTSYWDHYRDARPSFVEVAKGLVDLLHAQYHDHAALEPDFRPGSEAAGRELAVPLIARWLDSVEFHDGLVVIRKANGLRKRAVSVRH